ncbi:DUF493 domain-containing protein [Massilia sp. W12]|uniref:YbeD family protein n=1 Tax=Massilia sp. W12 TaxID=3126507 RepID=UPI0030CD25AD
MSQQEESLIEFPCDFPLKVMGPNRPEFVTDILQRVQQHDPQFTQDKIAIRLSSKGTYQSLTLTVHATDRAQLDAIYLAVTSHPDAKWTL